jgi:hypothetical protein
MQVRLSSSHVNWVAREEAQRFLAALPDFSMEHCARTQLYRHDEHFVDAPLTAGLPM